MSLWQWKSLDHLTHKQTKVVSLWDLGGLFAKQNIDVRWAKYSSLLIQIRSITYTFIYHFRNMTPEDDFRFVLFPQAKQSQAKYKFKYNVEIGRKLKLVMSRPKFYITYRTGTKHIQWIQHWEIKKPWKRFQFYLLDLQTPGVKTKVCCDN